MAIPDMAGKAAMAAAAPGGLHTVANADSGNLCRFVAAHDFTPGDKLVFNGVQLAVRNSDGGEYATGAWKAGDEVIVSVCDGYVKVLAPLHNKANVGLPRRILLTDILGGKAFENWMTIDDFGTVSIHIAQTGTLGNIVRLCSLPAGFRPENQQWFLGTGWLEKDSKRDPCAITSENNGIYIRMHSAYNPAQYETVRANLFFKVAE